MSGGKWQTHELRELVQSMERRIVQIGAPRPRQREAFAAYQQGQVTRIIKLEQEWRDALTDGPHAERGVMIYDAFRKYVHTLPSVLSGRLYFRERQTAFKAFKGALDGSDPAALYGYRVNYRFIRWAAGTGLLPAALQRQIAAIERLREEMVILLMPLAISRARMFWRRTPPSHLSLSDLTHLAMEGVLISVDKFAPPDDLEPGAAVGFFRSMAIGRATGLLIQAYSLDKDTAIPVVYGEAKPIKDFQTGDRVWGIDDDGDRIQTEVLALHDHGEVEGFEAEFDDGYRVVSSIKHKFLTQEGMVSLGEILERGLGVFCEPTRKNVWVADDVRHDGADEEEALCALEGVCDVSGEQEGEDLGVGQKGSLAQYVAEWVDESLRSAVREEARPGTAPDGLRSLHRGASGGEIGHDQEVQPGSQVDSESRHESSDVSGEASGERSGLREGLVRASRKGVADLASRSPGGERQDRQGDALLTQAEGVPAGGVPERGALSSMGVEAGSLSGSPSVGGGGRYVAFLELLEAQSTTTYPGARRDAPRRGPEEVRRDAPEVLGGELLLPAWNGSEDAPRVAPLAHSDAPLASTGGLVLRRVVRVRAVGLRRMYDLEVAHPKHNFLLPNGVVTSNSLTMLRFGQEDQTIIYRGNKIASRMMRSDGGIDYVAMAARLNLEAEGAFEIGPEDLVDLMAAASHVSADALVGVRRQVGALATPAAEAPDVVAATREGVARIRAVLPRLTLIQRKLLCLRGLVGVEEV